MSRNILKKRPPSSPNRPPHAPDKMLPKGQPVPLYFNFLVQGSTIQRARSAQTVTDKNIKYAGTDSDTKHRPSSAHVDKHVLQSMSRSPSVDRSFYDRFERLDRDSVIGDTAYKEKGVRVKSVGNLRHEPQRPSSSRPRKRSKSAGSASRKCTQSGSNTLKKPTTSSGSFFETAMSFDDETKQNTLSNAVRQISPRTLGIEKKGGHVNRRRPRSGRKSRDRSLSSKFSDGSDSQSCQSIGTSSRCSSAGIRQERHQRRQRTRKSRSRTRRTTPRFSDHGTSSKKRSPERKISSARSVSSASNRRKVIDSDNIRHRFIIKNLKSIPTPSCFETFEMTEHKGDFAYHYTSTPLGNRKEHKGNVSKRIGKGASAIDAVKKANDVQETLKEMKEIDRIMFPEERRPISSKLPKLKMMVAPTAMPLASLVRSTSAKMLMENQKRAF